MTKDKKDLSQFFTKTRQEERWFLKMHGLKNYFAIFDSRYRSFDPNISEIIKICDPENGINVDQVIIIQNPTKLGLDNNAAVFMRILNVDGREAEACGNATRCLAWALMKNMNRKEIRIETLAGVLDCYLIENDWVKCHMGKISMKPDDIPLSKNINTSNADINIGPLTDAVITNIGNPHITFFVDCLDDIDIEKWAPKIQMNNLFPEQVNVGVAEIIDMNNLRLKVFERGAGLTAACGSGACVAVYAAFKRKLIANKKINVILPAGNMIIELGDDEDVLMSGPVSYLHSGLWDHAEYNKTNH